ncbi:MAG: exodeoxyribonuclease III [Methylotenera sp.]|uniref:exodeoxyribonuclease III n=1 Tax=Methylotenera sp. TaxID=2051956 RepID=UPI00271B9D5F|nr:exodeoxyribonuclease III [Methylotenera sp.]MDO9393612.1 exodeoxyribonuclease III [Methylotenera sp.]MDP1523882.1 exodeoxyribonuclease III [Methylotenera sp.]MDP2231889.1 exodeoxyribonuclease III [Methylotenera sp.]MDP3140988.1 exodeoxyribonuclease III [Methylotenera sp.]MDZ4210732.1 exodeoxyribonuclease III [Methylotenera sp.]
MKLATWNVNSLNVRLPHVLDWLDANQADVLCLQETKQEDSKFPYEALKEVGYEATHIGQKTYNGVAILSRHPISNIQRNIPNFDDDQQRVLAATINGMRVICVYIPNGQAVDSDKYHYKMRWLNALNDWLKTELAAHPKLMVLGDYNIAPEDRDCHDPAAWIGQVLVSPAEREAFQQLLQLGLHDSFRLFEQPDKSFSWWDYRMMGFRRNFGMRIDHILVSDALKPACTSACIDKTPRKLERPSDHTPVVLNLN